MNLQDLPNLFRGLADQLEDTLETNKKVAELERALACAQLEIAELKIAQMDCMAKNSDLEQRVAELEAHVSEPVINCEARTTQTIEITEVPAYDSSNQIQQVPNPNQRNLHECEQDCSPSVAAQSQPSGAGAESAGGTTNSLEFLPVQEQGAGDQQLGAGSISQRIEKRRRASSNIKQQVSERKREADEAVREFREATISIGRRLDDFVRAVGESERTVEVQATELPTSTGLATTNQPILRGTTTSVSSVDDTGSDERPAKPSGSGKPKRVTVKPKRKNKKRRKPKGFSK